MYSDLDTSRITTLTGFNDFVLRNLLERAADENSVEVLEERALKPDGEDTTSELFLLHAGFRPRNILFNNDGGIVGIVYQLGEWYPWYPEGAQALNTISFSKIAPYKDNDWWRFYCIMC